MARRSMLQCILPPDLLHALARSGDDQVRQTALNALSVDHRFRLTRAESAARTGGISARPITFARIGGRVNRTIYDQSHSEAQSPGQVERAEGQDPTADRSVNSAYDGLGATYDFYWARFERDSIDGQGMHIGPPFRNTHGILSGHIVHVDGREPDRMSTLFQDTSRAVTP